MKSKSRSETASTKGAKSKSRLEISSAKGAKSKPRLGKSSEKGAKSKGSTRRPTAKVNQRALTAEEFRKLSESRRDVYNFCARSLAVPKYLISKKRMFTIQINYPAQDISVESTGNPWRAELQACLMFKEAIEDKLRNIPTLSEEPLLLNTSNADQFLRYYAKRQRCEKFEERTEPSLTGGVTSQAYCAGEPVGEPATAPTKKDVVPLAWLTAAVHLAQQNSSILHDFQHAERGNDGEILEPIRPIDFNIVPDMLNDMDRSSRSFLASASAKTTRSSLSERSWSNPSHTRRRSVENTDLRSSDLLQRYEAFMADPRLETVRILKDGLPMNQRRNEVLQLVNSNTFSIVVGATGSGKTTQVPQIILEDAILGKRGADVDIICTQPRRIAAKSVAVRVASERDEKLGDTVGYHVKGDNKTSREPGRMTYCTTGILLKQLQTDPDHIMDSASHIIIDEVHERDILIDFLMITLKKIIEQRQRSNQRVPNVVLMSATMDTELFSKYFQQKGSDGLLEPCPSISVPGRTFPVKEKYLETIMAELKHDYSQRDLRLLEDRDTKDYLHDEARARSSGSPVTNWQDASGNIATDMKDAIVPVSLVAATVAHITRTTTEGAILAFLPGLQEIVSTEKLLLQNPLGVDFSDTSKFRIFKLHSNLKDNQDEIFDPVPDGCRKIIISTNIAETSVTIPDVQHVVDSGKLREKRYNQLVQITKLQCVWVSKSNMRQRAGRAGRVQNGNYYALYSSSRYDSLETIGLPEMLRSDLMEVCLEVKAHSQYHIGEFLAGSIQPPNPVAVDASVQDLKDLEALTETEDLTPLGRLLASLPVHPSLGKMIILGVIFRCLDPLLILGASANERSLFARPLGQERIADKEKEAFGHGTFSDPLTTINAFRKARHNLLSSGRTSYRVPQFFSERYIHSGAFNGIDRTMREIESLLENVGIIPKSSAADEQTPYQCGHASLNRNSNNASLIRALVLAGHRGNLAIHSGYNPLFSTQKESRALIHRSSLNSFIGDRRDRNAAEKMSMLPSPTLLSFGSRNMNDQNDITLRDTSLVSPLIATLFGGELKRTGSQVVKVGDRLQFFIKSDRSYRAAGIVQQFRNGLDAMLSNALDDLAEEKTLADHPMRDQFASAVAHIIDQDFKLYMATGARQEFQGRGDRGRDGRGRGERSTTSRKVNSEQN
ncbi:P-loop containing nucleoside triphosphate hydrolase protein [Melanomma pulvis-pyrius CBS 109.77]|uniref:RNA helicase n=1 Tax=Melanomma pulvis-pyrius CBS 109.77 TaxID=1314802 RepID=A0A6A6X6V4_9PLEO|nr:P-loop containing nucleoside triphosphate hydrolase protein [Melanomma pulvis-pyrius CBS 109.77]